MPLRSVVVRLRYFRARALETAQIRVTAKSAASGRAIERPGGLIQALHQINAGVPPDKYGSGSRRSRENATLNGASLLYSELRNHLRQKHDFVLYVTKPTTGQG